MQTWGSLAIPGANEMTPNVLGVLFGIVLISYGLMGKGQGYNDVEMPLREEERNDPRRPFSRWGRISFVAFGCLLVAIGILRKFNW
jgi:hypothetical protein